MEFGWYLRNTSRMPCDSNWKTPEVSPLWKALERTQPMLPMGIGYVEGVTHDYRRHGTTTLFAALDTAKGTVITQCRQRHRHQEYLDFLRQIDKNVPTELDVHVILYNYATHKHPRVKRWLGPTHPIDESDLSSLSADALIPGGAYRSCWDRFWNNRFGRW